MRFAPPLVISEEDLRKAVKTIGECLVDLDVVRLFIPRHWAWSDSFLSLAFNRLMKSRAMIIRTEVSSGPFHFLPLLS